MFYRNGRIYNGEWFMGKRQGQGIMNYPNGDIYEGEWMKDFREGFGILKFTKGDTYEGEWLQDRMHGKGILAHPEGSVYEGIWEEGSKVEGMGIYKYANGNLAIRSNYTLKENFPQLTDNHTLN
mmetsp:Transcript_34282/g.33511  ORF Transcript_34282/g.33511 Transcript_34282/m.33511 type:complete len:124 (-) Transcript_34282:408-779(-)